MNRQTFETKPSREVLDQVFLSPRVLDKAAFEEFASIMKQLIERAAQDTRNLQAAAVQAELVHKRLAETTPLIDSRLTGAGEAIRSLDTRTAEVRAALGKAAESAALAQTAKADIDQLIRDCPTQFEARLAAVTESGKTALEAIKNKVEVNAQELGEAALRAMEVADTRLKDVESLAAARIGAMADQAERVILGLEARLNDVSQRITLLAGAGLSGIQALCDRAEALLGRDPADPDATPRAGSLADAISRAQEAEPVPGKSRAQSSVAQGSHGSFDPTEPCLVGEVTERAAAGRTAKPKRKPAKKAKPGKTRRSR